MMQAPIALLLGLFVHLCLGQNFTVQAGYHVIYSYAGRTPPTELSTYIRQGIVGGIVIFGDNVDDNLPDNIEGWQAAFAESPAYNGAPLLIFTDQEGGEISRLPGGPTLSEAEIGQASNPENAAETAGSQAASIMKDYNLNANLAPVLDVFRTPGDFDDQYERSYSQNATLAGICANAFISTQQAAGVLSSAKHFPGLGTASSTQNTDEVPVTLNVSLDELRSIDEVPYKAAISAGVEMIMPSWALYPSYDSEYPSGMSSKWIQNELRGRLGFTDIVTVSDAIEAGALEAFGDDPNRAVLAARAGMDIILCGRKTLAQGVGIVKELASQLNSGSLNQTAFDESTDRILRMRRKLASSSS